MWSQETWQKKLQRVMQKSPSLFALQERENALQTELKDVQAKIQSIVSNRNPIIELPIDRRTLPHPIKNVKLSVHRSFEWAKRLNCSLVEARNRAEQVMLAACHERPIPPEIMEYFEQCSHNYNINLSRMECSGL